MDEKIREIFYEALEILGINDVRYSHMPFSLRKKALAFDIYRLISEEVKLRSGEEGQLVNKEIFEYTAEEFESHTQIIHACIALLCLGYNEYAKPLIGYFDFPETRWTIKIDFILSRLVGNTRDHFRVPTYNERLNWQSKFIETHFYEKLVDLSETIWHRHTDISSDYYEYITTNYKHHGLAKISSTLGKSNIKDELECAEYYYINTYNFLKDNDCHSFIWFIDNSLDDEKIPFMETIVNSVVDVFYDLELAYEATFWETMLKSHEIEESHSIFFYKIFDKLYVGHDWSAYFVHKYFEEPLNPNTFQALQRIYKKDHNSDFIVVISELLNDANKFSNSVRKSIMAFNSYYRFVVQSFITTVYQSEKQSLLLTFDGRKKESDRLLEAFIGRFQANTNLFMLACIIEAKFPDKDDFYRKIKDLAKKRVYWETHLSADPGPNILEEYMEIFSTLLKYSSKDFDNNNGSTIDIF